MAWAAHPGPAHSEQRPNAVHAHLDRLARSFRARRSPAATDVRASAIWTLIGQTLVIAVLSPVAALITLALMDRVVGAGAHGVTAVLCGVGGLAVVYELILRRERSALAADVGVRVAAGLSMAWFQRLLMRDEPGGGTVSAQLAHFRALRRLRRLLSGPVVTALLDAPLAALICAGLFFWAGPLGFAPLVALVLHGAAAWFLYPLARRTTQRGARAREALRNALAESATKRSTLDEIGMTGAWAMRVEALAVEVAARRRQERVTDAAVDATARAITTISIVLVLWIGASRVASGLLTAGGVVAAAVMVWRCLTPIEIVFRAFLDLRFAAKALRDYRASRAAPAHTAHLTPLRVAGAVTLRGVVVAAQDGGAPALRGVSLDIAPGEIVAICGYAGAGKTTLLRTVLGQARPLSGAVQIDGRDLRSVDIASYRTQVAYAPQRTTLFHGSVAQNVRLLAPGVDEAGIGAALARSGVSLPHPLLPDGPDTRLMSGGGGHIDESLRTKIMLAGLYAKDARLLLLDDPGAFLDRDGDRVFLVALAALRGRATVLLATNRPSHMRACDRIVRLEHGMIVSDGPAAHVLGR